MLGYENGDKEKTRESCSRHTDSHRRRNSSTGAADPGCDAARREAVAEFAAAIRRAGHWNSDGGDLVPELLTTLPSWRRSGLVLEILEDRHNPVVLAGDHDPDAVVRQTIRVRRINNCHYRAIVDGMDVDLGANGDCFFYSVWYALETSVPEEERRRIYRGHLASGKIEAAAFFRNEIADYAVAHDDEVGDFLTHAPCKPASGIKPDGSESRTAETSAEDRAQSTGWSDVVPFALKEIGRALFHSVKSLSSAWGWTLLTGPGVRTIFEWFSLDKTGHWVTHTDIIEEGGVPVPRADETHHLIDLCKEEILEIIFLVMSARAEAIYVVTDALGTLTSYPEKSEVALDIFFGRHNDALIAKYRIILLEIKKFLKKINRADDIAYKAGYFKDKSRIAQTKAGSAGEDRDPLKPKRVTISVDALAEVLLKKKFAFIEFRNYLVEVLIHEAYHAVTKDAWDFTYVNIENEIVDISRLASLTRLDLLGDNVQEIADRNGITLEKLADLRIKAHKDSFDNPDNFAYLTVLLSNHYMENQLFKKFVSDYNAWKISRDSALAFPIRGHAPHKKFTLNIRTAIAKLISGEIEPLKKNGFLYRNSRGHIPIEFDTIIPGSNSAEVFDVQDPKFFDFIDTWRGGATTSQKNGVWSGTWGSKEFLNDDFSIIEIRGETPAVSAIKIDLSKITENYPLIISAGELRGSTIAFAVSGKGKNQCLYVFHAGHQAGDAAGQVSEKGVAGMYKAHLSMGGKPLESLKVSDAGISVKENGAPLDYRTLHEMLKNYDEAYVAYSGGMPNAPPADIATDSTIEWVDYAQGDAASTPGHGYAYALLARDADGVKFKMSTAKAPAAKTGGGAIPKKPRS